MNEEILTKLRELRVDRSKSPLFQSHSECLDWADQVAPLLKFNPELYSAFMDGYSYVSIETLSADTIMVHLNRMIGLQNQAIGELESPAIEREQTDSSEKPKTPNKVELAIDKAKNHPFLSVVIIICIALIGLEGATSSLSKLTDTYMTITGAKESPKLLQFAIVKNKSGYRETEEPKFAAGPRIKSYMPDFYISKVLPSYPVFQVSLENPNDKDMLVTDIKYHVSDIGGVKGGAPGILEAAYQYDYELKYEKGIQSQQLVPPFKIPAKSAGAFELVLTTKHDDIGLIWIVEIEFVTSTGSVKTDQFQLLLSGNPEWAKGMFKK